MAIVYVSTGAWGAGTGTPNSAAQVDGNFYDVDQRIVDVVADLTVGKRIDTVSYTANSMTFHFTDATSQIIPLPIATLQYIGPWMNDMALLRGHMISTDDGFYQVLQNHTTPPAPATFDPAAVDDGTDPSPLYQLWIPLRDVNYDAAIFVPGSIQREPDELLFQGIANRTMVLNAGSEGAYAYLEIGNDATDATNIVISIEKNGIDIGTISFAAGGDIDAAGGQEGTFLILDAVNFAEADRYALRVTHSDNVGPAGLSVTLPFIRTDIG